MRFVLGPTDPKALVARKAPSVSAFLFPLLFLAAVAVRLVLVWLLPPLLDVYYYDAQAARALLSGIDPYGFVYANIPAWLSTPGATNVFAYLPGVVLFLAPFGAVSDVRLGLVFADVLVGVSIYALGGKKAESAALAFILVPFTALFSTSYPNNTLVSIAFLSLAVAFWSKGRETSASTMVGAALASSQLVWFLYPLVLAWLIKSRRLGQIAIQVVVALVLTLPFAVWNFSSFAYDTILFQFTREPRTLISAAAFGFNVNPTLDGVVFTLTGLTVPFLLRAALCAVCVVYAVLKTRDLPSLLLNGSWLMLLVIFVVPDVFSWWYLELPLVTLLMWYAGTRSGLGVSPPNA